MAGEITYQGSPGLHLYGVLVNSQGLFAGNSAFEAQDITHWSNYAIPLTDSTGSGIYIGSAPTWLPATGTYTLFIRFQAGDTPAFDDPSEAEKLFGLNGIPVISANINVPATTLAAKRGDTWSLALTSLGNISARTKLWFTIKNLTTDDDVASIVQITESGGLITLNKSSVVTSGHGSITVNDATAGNITVALRAAETAVLSPGSSYSYDVQMLTAGGVVTLVTGIFNITSDVTRAVA